MWQRPPPCETRLLRTLALAALLGAPSARRTVGPVGAGDSEDLADREITFFRHGKSVGNAGVWGAITMGSVTAYRDGILTSEGEEQVKRRVGLLDSAHLRRALAAEVVLTSPLRRAMATTLQLLGSTQHRRLTEELWTEPLGGAVAAAARQQWLLEHTANCSGGACHGIIFNPHPRPPHRWSTRCVTLPDEHRWPPVHVVAELREKVKSYSDVPGSGDQADAMEYVRAMGERVGREYFCDRRALDPVVQDIARTYAEEAARTKDWTLHYDGVPAPENVWTLVRMIEAFKHHVLGVAFRDQRRVMLVGHNGWSRHAFAHLLPGPANPFGWRREDSLATGLRAVRPLNNVGVFCARAVVRKRGQLVFERDGLIAYPDGVQPGTTELPNFNKKARKVLLGFPLDSRMAGVIPQDSLVRHFFMDKAGSHTGIWRPRIYMLSHSDLENRSFLAWSDEYGEPRESLRIQQGTIWGTTNTKELTITLFDHDHWQHKIRAPSRAEFDSFIGWLQFCVEADRRLPASLSEKVASSLETASGLDGTAVTKDGIIGLAPSGLH